MLLNADPSGRQRRSILRRLSTETIQCRPRSSHSVLRDGRLSPTPAFHQSIKKVSPPGWPSERHHHLICRDHQLCVTAIMTMLALHAKPQCILSVLPKEILIEMIFPHISYGWFSGARTDSSRLKRMVSLIADFLLLLTNPRRWKISK